MSIESILLVAFLVLPLLERLSRYLRARAARTPADPAGAPPRQRSPALPGLPIPDRAADASGATGPAVPPVGVSPPVLVPPALPPLPPRHPAVERLSAGERVRAARTIQADQAARAPDRGASARARHAVALRSGRADLRRAVALMTVLGPCQALKDEAGRHRQ